MLPKASKFSLNWTVSVFRTVKSSTIIILKNFCSTSLIGLSQKRVARAKLYAKNNRINFISMNSSQVLWTVNIPVKTRISSEFKNTQFYTPVNVKNVMSVYEVTMKFYASEDRKSRTTKLFVSIINKKYNTR